MEQIWIDNLEIGLSKVILIGYIVDGLPVWTFQKHCLVLQPTEY